MPPISTPNCKTVLFLLLLFSGVQVFGQPVINSFTPNAAAQGASVRISGKYFTGTTAVSFGGVAASSFSLEDDTAVIAVVGSGATGNVVVTTPGGSDTVSGFTWKAQAEPPSIYYFSPTSGRSGDTVLITGRNLTTANGVAFGGTEAANHGVKNDSVIWAVVGSGATGVVNVINSDGSGSGSVFTYIPGSGALHLTHFYPDSVSAGGTVYISGMYLDGITSVSFGGVRARSYTLDGDTVLVAVVDTGASGKIMVAGEWGIDSLNGFRIIGSAPDTGSTTPPPPVMETFQLQNFMGIDSTDGILLLWNTAYDQKIQNYQIFTGQDSTNLAELGTTPSLKEDNTTYSYMAVVGTPGPWYFRLHMQDSAGVVTYSPVISVTRRGNMQVVTGYPNPVTNMVTMAVPPTNATSVLLVTDPGGRVVRTIVVAPNTLQVTINVANLNNGVYKVGWSDGKHKSSSTILVVR